jgi:leucyl/phenylalanyl-tRNA--protein transferase
MAFETQRLAMPAAAPARERLFRESPRDMVERWALGTVWALMPKRASGLPNLAKLCLRELLSPDYALPDPEAAFADPPGLAGIVHDFSPQTIMEAYRRGLFAFAHLGPLKWWSPPLRSLLFWNELHFSKRLKRTMRQNEYRVTFDRDFDGVMKACGERRPGKWHVTWITPKIMHAYAELFDLGHAHSFEVWNQADQLVGGGYGVSVGGSFVTESQFSRESNTSKIGFTVLHWHLAKWGYAFSDGKLMTPTCADMGFRDVPRSEFLARLAEAQKIPPKSGRWQVEADVAEIAEWNPAG